MCIVFVMLILKECLILSPWKNLCFTTLMLPSTKCSALLQEFVTKVTPEWGQQINQVLVTNVGYAWCIYIVISLVISLNPFKINPEPSLSNFPCPILTWFVCASMRNLLHLPCDNYLLIFIICELPEARYYALNFLSLLPSTTPFSLITLNVID